MVYQDEDFCCATEKILLGSRTESTAHQNSCGLQGSSDGGGCANGRGVISYWASFPLEKTLVDHIIILYYKYFAGYILNMKTD